MAAYGENLMATHTGQEGPPLSRRGARSERAAARTLLVVCRVAGVSRSAACEARRRRGASEPPRRRSGPVGAMTDSELLAEIRAVLATSPFVGESHRKVWARLRRRGVCTSRKRVLQLTRGAGLLARTARVRKRAQRLHEGTITVTVPDTLWATDATEGWSEEGRCAVFVMIDHASGEAWADAGLRMDRFAAADLLREVTTERFGSVAAAVAAGLAPALRRRTMLSLRALPGRDRPPRHRPLPRLPLRARDQRLRGEVHPDPQGADPLARALRHLRGAPRRHPPLRGHLQPRVAARTPRLPHPNRGTRAPPRPRTSGRGMIALFTRVSGELGPGHAAVGRRADRRQPSERARRCAAARRSMSNAGPTPCRPGGTEEYVWPTLYCAPGGSMPSLSAVAREASSWMSGWTSSQGWRKSWELVQVDGFQRLPTTGTIRSCR